MLKETLSKYGFDETESRLIAAFNQHDWKLLHTVNFQETMRRFGKDVLPSKTIEICKPELAYMILKLNDERIVTSMMPCRISIYEKADGLVYVSTLASSEFPAEYGETVNELINATGIETEKLLQAIAN